MRTRYSWSELIPADETRMAVSFIASMWDRCSHRNPDFSYRKHEPKLTELLYMELYMNSQSAGLTGFWQNEPQHPMLDEEGKVIRIRKDIVYLSNQAAQRLNLIFEFKKITNNRSAYLGKDGLSRFITGNYAIDEPLAFMVGIMKADDENSIDALYRSLCNSAQQRALRMVHDVHGQYIVKPSKIVDSVVTFDTEHNRPPEKAPKGGTITVGHIFLRCSI